MSCCDDPVDAAGTGTLKAFLYSEDHAGITTAWHLCLECHQVWSDDERNGWRREPFEKLLNQNVWVTGIMGRYPESELTDIETFARWVSVLETPLHTVPMV